MFLIRLDGNDGVIAEDYEGLIGLFGYACGITVVGIACIFLFGCYFFVLLMHITVINGAGNSCNCFRHCYFLYSCS